MRGLMYEFVGAMLGLFVVSLLFIAMNQAWVTTGGLNDFGDDNIRINTSSSADTASRNIFTIMDTIWIWFPVLALFLFLFYMIIRSQERTPPF